MDDNLKQRIDELVREEVAIVPYSSAWPNLFEQEAAFLRSELPSNLVKRIEHFGSTAVPGLSAKPIIDILVEVSSLEETKKQIVPILQSKGYEYFWRPIRGNQPPYYAWFIKRDCKGKRTHHIHMVEADSELWEGIYFRDYLREFPDEAKRYEALKESLAEKFPNDREAYTKGKTKFIFSSIKKAKGIKEMSGALRKLKGTRRCVGLIIPASNTTFEADFARAISEEVTFYPYKLQMPGGVEDESFVDKVNAGIEEATEYLAKAKVDIIAYGFTTGSFYRGVAYCKQLEEQIERMAGVPAVTPASAIVDALRYFGIKNISVATPYPEWNNSRLLAYLNEAGFRILNLEGDSRTADIVIREPMWNQKTEAILEFASRVYRPEADALLCPCTAWRVLDVIEKLEQQLKVPVITANQATIWTTLRKLEIFRPIYGFGRLLEKGFV